MTTRQIALALCLTLSLPPIATAQTAEAPELETEARARFSLGELYYSQARFGDAAREFEAAYALHPHPLLLHNLYLARRDMGDFPGAVDALTRYLAAAPELSAADRRLLEGRLATMQHQLASTPTPTPEPSTPPPDPVVGDAVPVEVGETLATPSDDEPPPAPAAHGDDGLWSGAIAAYSVAGAALVMMVITGPLALTERDHLASSCAPACSDDQVSTARTLGTVTDVGLGIAAVGAAAGIVLTVLASTSTSADVSVTPSVSADHAGIVVGGRF